MLLRYALQGISAPLFFLQFIVRYRYSWRSDTCTFFQSPISIGRISSSNNNILWIDLHALFMFTRIDAFLINTLGTPVLELEHIPL
jgi:hypothetical protein